MKRALSPSNLLEKKIDRLSFAPPFADAFDHPARRGVWFVWGKSGNGKTRFLLQLTKELVRQRERVIYNSLEEGDSDTMVRAFAAERMSTVNKSVFLVSEDIEELKERLRKPKSPKVVIVDTIQYCRLYKQKFFAFVKEFERTHLIIINSQSDERTPRGSVAVDAKYHASLKIYVEGFRAFSHGRYYGPIGHYDIWAERAADYWPQHIQSAL